jgi:phage terminase large subunit GpA-like protein
MTAFLSSPESTAALHSGISAGLRLFTPPPSLLVSEWADTYVRLPRESSPEPGPWVTDRAVYQREMMDVANDPAIETVVYMIASQCGKTACELNILGYFAHQDPSPILFVLPSEQIAEDVSKERIAPMIRDTPVLRPLFGTPKAKESGNTLLKKQFPGGFLALAGSNAPRGLASRPVRILIGDEIDGYPASAGSEGDPITLAEARTTNFWNRKRFYSSTPSIKNASRIEKLEEQSDRRRFHVPCPHCGDFQTLEWESLKWPSPRTGAAKHNPGACYYVCINGCEILELEKLDMIRNGHWVKTNPGGGDGKTAGFQLSALYSPWKSWSDIIEDWLKAHKKPQERKAFWNTRLGRTYEILGDTVDYEEVASRRIRYPAEVPAGALVLTAGFDVQTDRIEMEVVGWGKDEESWSIEYRIFKGSPGMPEIWNEIDAALKKLYLHESGVQVRIVCAYIDSGYHTKQVYRFCKPRQLKRIYACKGQSGIGVPLNKPRPQRRTHAMRVDLRLVGIDAAKESLYERLKLKEVGAGYCHFPTGYVDRQGVFQERREYDAEYFEQLTSEKLVSEMQGMTPVRKWQKKRERNEALDCRVYAMAALDDLQPDWARIAKSFEARKDKVGSEPKPQPEAAIAPVTPVEATGIPIILPKHTKPQAEARKPNSWVNSWRD